MLSRSPERHTFQSKRHRDVLESDPTNEEARATVKMYDNQAQRRFDQEKDPEWAKDNLEADLRATNWILEKTRESKAYAQHLYAALCDNDFIKNEVWPLLQEKRWSCSWRAAGGIVANMRQEGDYVDWYCSGIREIIYQNSTNVSEGVITDEIRADLLKLGWLAVDC